MYQKHKRNTISDIMTINIFHSYIGGKSMSMFANAYEL